MYAWMMQTRMHERWFCLSHRRLFRWFRTGGRHQERYQTHAKYPSSLISHVQHCHLRDDGFMEVICCMRRTARDQRRLPLHRLPARPTASLLKAMDAAWPECGICYDRTLGCGKGRPPSSAPVCLSLAGPPSGSNPASQAPTPQCRPQIVPSSSTASGSTWSAVRAYASWCGSPKRTRHSASCARSVGRPSRPPAP